ncbi:MAG: DUF4160 domain-containing protein [Elusimicrobiota bacterium]|jgi:hypothetical protein|nr:DUF4160 domain-containing protein [Elusimicrobiota bacterium]
MPEIARFYGIVIKMFFRKTEHNPPHIHAVYGEYVGSIDIRTGEMTEGDLPAKAISLIQEWLNKNKKALLDMWKKEKITKLPPLK